MNKFHVGEDTIAWIDHPNNFSFSFSELLQQKELIDVTLMADGYLINAHRLVLSALSPYFRKMFTNMPVNQQAFLFLKDVSKETLEHLITFIYRGEVNVAQEELKDFLTTAKALQIKGIIDQPSPEPHWPTPAHNAFQFQSCHTMRFNNSTNVKTKPANNDRKRNHSEYGYVGELRENTPALNFGNDGNGHRFIDDMHNDDFASEQKYDAQNQEQNGEFETNVVDQMQADAPTTKRARNKEYAPGYDIVADIRTNGQNREHIFYNNAKFGKRGKPLNGRQHWMCTKHNSCRCKAAVRTMEVDGVVMMRVSPGEHSHGTLAN